MSFVIWRRHWVSTSWNAFRQLDSLSSLAVPDQKLEPIGFEKVTAESKDTLAKESSLLVYNLPKEWFSKKMAPVQKRERMVLRISEWAKRKAMTPTLLWKLVEGPLSQQEISKYSSSQLARIVYSIGLMKKSQRLVGDSRKIQRLIHSLLDESTSRQRLITYDGIALSQTAFGFTMMELGEAETVMRPFAEEAIKEHRIRNTQGKCIVNLLESFYSSNYTNQHHVKILSEAAIKHLTTLPTFALPKLLLAWSHFQYRNLDHIKEALAETLKEDRLNAFLPTHIEEVLIACARLKLKDPSMITLLVRELLYSQKWKFMGEQSLPRVVWAFGELQHKNELHWKQVLTSILESDQLLVMDSRLIVDVFVGWSKVSFRDSKLLDKLTLEAKKEARLLQYSTRQLFEIFKAQSLLGQVEKDYTEPFVEQLRDVEKLMKSDLQTKVKIFLYPQIKKFLGMKAVASLAQRIFQPLCLDRFDTVGLLQLSKGLALLGPRFNICFTEVVCKLLAQDRRSTISTQELLQVLDLWNQLEYEDQESLSMLAKECKQVSRLKECNEQELVALLWFLSVLNCQNKDALNSIIKETLQRSMSSFTGKGLTMILTCISKTQCIQKDDIKPIIDEALKKEKLESMPLARLKILHCSLTELGVEDGIEQLIFLIK